MRPQGPSYDDPPPLAEILTKVPVRPDAPDELPLFGGRRAKRMRRTRRIAAAVAVVLVLSLVAGAAFVLSQRNAQTTVSLDDAVDRFRTEAAAPAEEARSTTAVAGTAERPRTSQPTREGPGSAKVADPETVPSEAVPYRLPAEGVYTYRTRGGESVSLFGAKHAYPARTFATVRHLGGCQWEHRNEVIEEHVDVRNFCGAEGLLHQLMQERRVTFFGTTDGAALDCEPPMIVHRAGEKKGATTEAVCADDNGNKGVMTRTLMGAEAVEVGDVTIEALRVDIAGETTGKAVGSSFDSVWIHPETGMTLRWDRTVDTLASAFGAKVRYQEDASFVLESLDPQR